MQPRKRSKIWSEIHSEQIKLQLSDCAGNFSYSFAGGMVHLWSIGIPGMAWCGRYMRRINKDIDGMVRVCDVCLAGYTARVDGQDLREPNSRWGRTKEKIGAGENE